MSFFSSEKYKGCGFGATMLLVPQFIFKARCSKHDDYYKQGGGLLDKVYADVMFYALMLEDIKKGGFGFFRRYGYFLAATLYFLLVLTLGLLLFRWHLLRYYQRVV